MLDTLRFNKNNEPVDTVKIKNYKPLKSSFLVLSKDSLNL